MPGNAYSAAKAYTGHRAEKDASCPAKKGAAKHIASPAPPGQHQHHRKAQRRDQRHQIARGPSIGKAVPDHQRHPDKRQRHGRPGHPVWPFADPHPSQHRGEERRKGQKQQRRGHRCQQHGVDIGSEGDGKRQPYHGVGAVKRAQKGKWRLPAAKTGHTGHHAGKGDRAIIQNQHAVGGFQKAHQQSDKAHEACPGDNQQHGFVA